MPPITAMRRCTELVFVPPRFDACGDNYAPLGALSDSDRTTPKLGIIALFDRRVGGVHVDVDDLAERHPSTISGLEQKENPAPAIVTSFMGIGKAPHISRRLPLVRANVFAAQSDLFGRPTLAGLAQAEAVVTNSEEQALIASIDRVELSPFRFHGWQGKRLTASFGWRYDFEDASFEPTDAIPEWVLPLRERAAQFAHLSPEALVQALLTRYDPGAGIGWHRDRPVFEHVIGVSLGAPATMRFRRRKRGGFDRASAELPPRSIYHLSGEARHQWEHSIAEMAVTRWSITFRSLSEKGRRYGEGHDRTAAGGNLASSP